MSKTKVTEAPWGVDGSLLHYPSDGQQFSHYEDADGNRIDEDQAFILQKSSMTDWDGTVHIRTRSLPIPGLRKVMTEADWRPNEPFHATFQIDSMRTGRSAKYVILKAANAPLDKRTYPMFVSDLLDVLTRSGVERGGIMSGRWMVSQRGANYGLRLAKDGE